MDQFNSTCDPAPKASTPQNMAVVRVLRLWMAGEDGRAQAQDELADTLGAQGAAMALSALSDLVTICETCALCPLRIAGHCPGIDQTERCFADFVTAAATGDRETALMHGFCLMRPDAAFVALPYAQKLGFALRRADLARDRQATRH